MQSQPINHFRNIALVLLILFSTCPAFSQNLVQTIRGQVIDEINKAPVIGANVVVVGTNPLRGSSSDVDGNFVIPDVPIGRHTLKITVIGYEEVTLSEVLVNSAKENVLTIQMRESFETLEDIVITAENERGKPKNELATVSARSLTVEDAKNYAASINDPSRVALSFAGVTTGDDETNEIIIRGNSPRNILWRVEGIEVPNPNHFSEDNSGAGGISILSVNVLDNSDFFTGAFPAEYGNGTSGVFDLSLRRGNSFKREYAFQAGLLGLDFAAEGPFKKNSGKASYLINYRYSTLGILEGLGLITTFDVIPVFQDLSFKVHLPTQKAGTFSIWGLGGLSDQNDDEEGFSEQFGSDLGVAGLNHRIFLGKETLLETGMVFSYQRLGSEEEEADIAYKFEDAFINKTLRGKLQLNHKFNSRFSIRTGVIGAFLDYEAFERESFQGNSVTTLDEEGNTSLWQGYLQGQIRLRENLSLNLGLHTMYFSLNGNYSLEPRAGFKWNLSPRSSLSAGYGRHSRIESMSVYFARNLDSAAINPTPNRNLALSFSDHYVLGYDQFFGEHWHMKLEAYYQYLSDVPIAQVGFNSPEAQVFSVINIQSSFVNLPLANDGSGENYGIEMTLERFFTDGWYMLFTGAWFESKFKARDGINRDTRFNFNYVTNFLLGKEFKIGKNSTFGINGRFIWNGGPRFFDYDRVASQDAGFPILDYERGYALEAPDYYRLDIRLNIRWNRPKVASILSLDIQNVTGRTNVFSYDYSVRQDALILNEQLGFVPILNYRMEF